MEHGTSGLFLNLYSFGSSFFPVLLLGSAEGHEYPDLQVGDEVDPRLFLIPIKIYNIDPL